MSEIVTGQDQFPIYYAMEPRPFMVSGVPSGAAGARAKLSYAVPTAVHFIYGIRITNYYPLPSGLDADGVAMWEACRRYVDQDQSIMLDLSQQSIFVNEVIQSQVTGRDGVHWHPFPVPYRINGGNAWGLTVTRLTDYPSLPNGDAEPIPILPMVGATIVCGVFRGDMATQPPKRYGG